MMPLFLAMAFCATAVPSIAAPTDEAAILASRTTVPGVVVEVARIKRDGSVTYENAGKLDNGNSANEHTVFEIGSVTKTFTATILASMVLDGSVKLDDPVQKYLPADVHMPQRDGKAITLLDLAEHRSGLPRMPNNMHPKDPADPYAGYDKPLLYEFLNKLSLTRDPGALYEYSNLGASVLGTVLANRAGTTYAALLQQRVLDPLGMHETGVVLTPAMTPRLAPGHTADGELTTLWNFDAMAPAGAIRSTAADLAKFVRCQLGEGPLAKACLFAQTPRAAIPGRTHIGLIWMTGDITHITQHGGDVYGWHAGVALAPDRALGIVTLTNGDPSIDDVAMHLIDPSVPVEIPPPYHAVAIDPAKIDQYVGAYVLNIGAANVPFIITRDQDHLYTRLGAQQRLRIFPTQTPDAFEASSVGAKLVFVRDAAGKVTTFTLMQAGQVTHGALADAPSPAPPEKEATPARVFPPIANLDDATLASYVGDYAAGDRVFSITKNSDGLVSKYNIQPPLPMFASGKDAFFVKAVDAQLTFNRNDRGGVTTLVLHQDGQNIPFKRLAQPAPPDEPDTTSKQIAVAPEIIVEYAGRYEMATHVVYPATGVTEPRQVSVGTVTSQGGYFTFRFDNGPDVPLYPESPTVFFAKIVDAKITFFRDPVTHAVTRLVFSQGGHDRDGKRLPDKSVP